MNTCAGCGGTIGRDCFNPRECEEITRSLAEEQLNQRHVDWDNLRSQYFDQCVDKKPTPKINMAPHDLFEWFKEKIKQSS